MKKEIFFDSTYPNAKIVQTTNNSIIIEYGMQDGEVYAITLHDRLYIFIYKTSLCKELTKYVNYFVNMDRLHIDDMPVTTSYSEEDVRLATKEEKEILFSAIDKAGLRWDAERKLLTKKRWRAAKNNPFYFITLEWPYIRKEADNYTSVDEDRYLEGNYFQTKEEAKIYLTKIQSFLKDRP